MDNLMPEVTQPVNSQEQTVAPADDTKVVEEAKARAGAFHEAYKKLSVEFRCNHKAIINATADGIFPSFAI